MPYISFLTSHHLTSNNTKHRRGGRGKGWIYTIYKCFLLLTDFATEEVNILNFREALITNFQA